MFLFGSGCRRSLSQRLLLGGRRFVRVVQPRFSLFLVLLFLCGGCLVGPDFSSPSAPVADKWLESNNPSVDTRNQEYRDWWKVFHDPVLNRLIEIAYNQNLTLVSAGTKVLEARAQLGVAIGEFYPQLQQGHGSVTYIRPGHADTTQFPIAVTRNFWRDALGLTVNWELDFWGKFRRAIESADASYLASIANYDYVLATLLGDVATTYIGIRTLQTQIEIARENIVKQKKALAIATAKYQGGTATKLDVYQAQNVLAQTEATIPQLTIQLDQGLDALAVLLGMTPQPMDGLLKGASGIPVPPKTVAVGIPADLVRRRPDIRAAELAAMAQSAQNRHCRGEPLSGVQPDRDFRHGGQQHRTRQAEASLRGARHNLCLRTGIPMEHSQLRADHQPGPGRGRGIADASGRVPKRRSEGAAGSRERVGELSPRPRTGRFSAPERRRSECSSRARFSAIQFRHQRFHDSADRRAESLHGAEQSRDGGGQRIDRVGIGLPRAGGRMADPRGQRIRSYGDRRGDERPDQLGRAAATSGHAAAA